MNAAQDILDLLRSNPGLKAKEIASRLGMDRMQVNALLYGDCRQHVVQDKGYRWKIRGGEGDGAPAMEEATLTTPLARLCRYYLDCLAQDAEHGISVFASSQFGTDYVELPVLPLLDNVDVNIFEAEEPRRLLNRMRQDRGRLALYLGYPVRLRRHRGRNGWEGFFVEPIMLVPFIQDPENRYAIPEISDEQPHFNFKALKELNTFGGSRLIEEVVQLSDELGFSALTTDDLDVDELFLRLRDVRPEWDWLEVPDPHRLVTETNLAELQVPGIYNRAIVVLGERSPYTHGLETELSWLGKVPQEHVEPTALGLWLSGETIEADNPPQKPLLEVLPLNTEQRLAVTRGLSSPLTVITGPPGTGKSQVVTSLLINAAWQGKRVLFASKNNKAVDVVEARVNALGPRPVLLRLGRSEYQRRLADYLVGILAATSTAEDQHEYERQLHQHETIRGQFGVQEQETALLVKARNAVDQLEQTVEDARSHFSCDAFFNLKDFDTGSVDERLSPVATALGRAIRENQPFLCRLFWGLVKKGRYSALAGTLSGVTKLAEALEVEIHRHHPDDEHIGQWKHFFDQLVSQTEMAKRVRQYFNAYQTLLQVKPLEQIGQEQMALVENMAESSERLWSSWLRLQPSRLSKKERKALGDYSSMLQLIIQADESNQKAGGRIFTKYRSLFPEVVGTLSCWAVTSLAARGRIPLDPGFFDLLVIDEASQCDIASVLPLLFRAKAAVIIGDPNQLKHISTLSARQDQHLLAKHELIEEHAGWGYSVNSLFHLACNLCSSEDIINLRDHHRSHADIIGFSNDQFYEGRLRIATRYDKLNLPNRDEPAVRWRTVVGHVRRPASSGAQNDDEAKAVVEEIRRLVLYNGYRGTVGVVTPFRAQANRIRDLMTKAEDLAPHVSASDLLVDTAHRFQGDERDVMVFSPVVSEGISDTALGFLRGNRNLFNVAITRARAALVVVGDQQAALNCRVDYLSRFAAYVRDIEKHAEIRVVPTQDFGPEYPPVSHPERVSGWERLFYRWLYVNDLRPIPQYDEEQYTLDFALFDGDRKLNIEIDGERYHRNWDGELCRRDLIRNQRLIELGWDVKRFWVYQIRDDIENCVKAVLEWAALGETPVTQMPSPDGIEARSVREESEGGTRSDRTIQQTVGNRRRGVYHNDAGYVPPKKPGDPGYWTVD